MGLSWRGLSGLCACVRNEGGNAFGAEVADDTGGVADAELDVGFGEDEGAGEEGFSFGEAAAYGVDGRGSIVAEVVDGEAIDGVPPIFVWEVQSLHLLLGQRGGFQEGFVPRNVQEVEAVA